MFAFAVNFYIHTIGGNKLRLYTGTYFYIAWPFILLWACPAVASWFWGPGEEAEESTAGDDPHQKNAPSVPAGHTQHVGGSDRKNNKKYHVKKR